MSLSAAVKKKFKNFSMDVTLHTDGEPLGVLGASGCGKSMTLKCIAGIEHPDSGVIALNNQLLYDSEQKICISPQKRRIGYLFQNYALFPHMTVKNSIAAGVRGTREEIAGRVADMMKLLHLEGLEERYPAQLSGGQQQRVALARILAYDPEVLLLDEPFSALDTYLREKLLDQIDELLDIYHGEVILVTHNPREIYKLCSRILVMGNGGVLMEGPVSEISESSALGVLEKVYENAYTVKSNES